MSTECKEKCQIKNPQQNQTKGKAEGEKKLLLNISIHCISEKTEN